MLTLLLLLGVASALPSHELRLPCTPCAFADQYCKQNAYLVRTGRAIYNTRKTKQKTNKIETLPNRPRQHPPGQQPRDLLCGSLVR